MPNAKASSNGLFSGLDAVIRAVFANHAVPAKGKSHGSKSYYKAFQKLLRHDSRKASAVAVDLLVGCYQSTRDKIGLINADTARQGGRGQLRVVVELSQKRQVANLNAKPRDFEVTLERAIAAAQKRNTQPTHIWHNQLNVGSGLFGRSSDKKTSIDLVRASTSNTVASLDLIELKEWKSSNHPLYAALEIFRYWCAIDLLGRQKKDPHAAVKWPLSSRYRLFVLAPTSWHEKHTIDDVPPSRIVATLADAMLEARNRVGALSGCDIYPDALKLQGLESRESFINVIRDPNRDNGLVSFEQMPEPVARQLRDWTDRAFPD